MAANRATIPPSEPRRNRALHTVVRVASDQRILRTVGQFVFLVVIVFTLVSVWNTVSDALASRNLTPNFTFLENRAGFAIGGAEGYSPDDPYLSAYFVGLRNSLSIIAAGLVLATFVGIVGGILLLSTNWLLRNIARGLVEILRNTPLLVQIFVMFFVVVLALPPFRESLTVPGEGLFLVTWRVVLYLAAAGLLALAVRRADAATRSRAWAGLVGAVLGYEIIRAIALARPATDEMPIVLVAAGIGLACLVAWWRLRRAETDALLGIGLGILLAAAAFAFDIVPPDGIRLESTPFLFLNNRGLTYPELLPTGRFATWFVFVALGLGLASFLYAYMARLSEQTGKPYPKLLWALLLVLGFSLVGWVVVSAQPVPAEIAVVQDGELVLLSPETAYAEDLIDRTTWLQYRAAPVEVLLPQQQGLRFSQGTTLSPEYVALLLALVVYTSAFIAEIVRAGILAVPYGQIEAARSLGLGYGQMLRLVVLPQALRVIIPPLTNQYTNLAKNSSLAIAIAYADVFQVMNTVGNQSGQSVTSIIIVMLTYVVITLVIAGVMNWVNARFQIVTR